MIDFDIYAPARVLLEKIGITALLNTQGVTEVAINRPGEIWYEQNAIWHRKEDDYITYDTCVKLAHALCVQKAGKSNQLLDNPICSVRLPDDQRCQVVMPPATEKGCVSITIRRPSTTRFPITSYTETGRFSKCEVETRRTDLLPFEKQMLQCLKDRQFETFLRYAVANKLNIICGGQTGSGKTTFLKSMADLYPANRRYATIEDTPELDLPLHPNHVRLFYNDNKDSAGNVTVSPSAIVASCMRMKFDHIFMGELRGHEVLGYFELLETGHPGSLTSAHYNNCNEAFSRLTNMVLSTKAGSHLGYDFVYASAVKALDVVTYWEHGHLIGIKYDPETKLRLLNGESL